MDDEYDEEECESVNEPCVNVNKTPQENVTKAGPDNLLEKNLKRIMYKMPQKHKARVDPDSLLRKSLKKIVYGRLGLETTGVRRRGQSLKQSGNIEAKSCKDGSHNKKRSRAQKWHSRPTTFVYCR